MELLISHSTKALVGAWTMHLAGTSYEKRGFRDHFATHVASLEQQITPMSKNVGMLPLVLDFNFSYIVWLEDRLFPF